MNKTIRLILSLLSLFAMADIALAAPSAWTVTGSGGGQASSVNYIMNSTAGQAVIGTANSAGYGLGAGFWYANNSHSTNGLVAEYHFSGDAQDSSGNNRHGTINSATFTQGVNGQALSFDGVDDYVYLGNWFTYQTFSISMWANPADSQSIYANIIDNNHRNGINWVLQQDSSNVNRYGWGCSDNAGIFFNLIPDKWTQIVMTRNGSTRVNTVYIDGTLLSTTTGTNDIYYSNQYINLGKLGIYDNIGGSRYWHGKMDEVSIYNRALSADEIKKIYEDVNLTLTASPSVIPAYIPTDITFTVTSKATPISNATITLTGTATGSALTNASGQAVINVNASAGYIEVTASKNGYINRSIVVDVQGIIAEYHFNGDAQDSSGNNNHGTINGATFVQGLNGQALSFSAPGTQYVDVPNFGTFTTFTVSGWIYRTGVHSTRESILSYKEGDSPNCGFVLSLNEDTSNQYPRIYVQVSDSWKYAEQTSTIPLNTWIYLAATYDGSVIKLYRDGIEAATGAFSGSMSQCTQDTRIGNRAPGSVNHQFPGIIDEVRIYNRALSADEIKNIYEYANLTLIAFPSVIPANTPTNITFTVTSNSIPVSNATITFTGAASGSTLTNASGQAIINVNASAGNIIATANKSGYLNATTTLIVSISDKSPPIATNNSSNHEIPDDTDKEPLWGETAQLNVTVTDESNILSVTINLSEIGGSSAKPMLNIGGNIYSTTTNASAGTPPKVYNLTVNATDVYGNSNTSVMIQLRVLKNGDCTGNNIVNIGDALRLANNVSYPGNPAYALISPYVCEVTGNGILNIGDALRLANNVSYQGNLAYILK